MIYLFDDIINASLSDNPAPSQKESERRMTLFEFNGLDETEKYNTLWDKDALIADRREKVLELSSLSDKFLYAEMYYNMNENKIERLKRFPSTKSLEIYLKRIKINEL